MPIASTLWNHIMEVKNAFSPGGPAYVPPPEGVEELSSPQQTMSISPNPPEPGRNLANPYLPGTKAFTKRVDEWQPPNPLTTKAFENYMYDVGAVAPIAYHGTPHKFDKFDVSKIGTGEGAQAFGHGLYFAENPKVAGEYQTRLAKSGDPMKVNIKPEAEKFLDFDAPIREQVDIYQKIKNDPLYNKIIEEQKQTREKLVKKFRDAGKESPFRSVAVEERLTGEHVYKDYAHKLGSHKKASEHLRGLGIPGNRYLDEGSREIKNINAYKDEIALVRKTIDRTPNEKLPAGDTLHDRYRMEIQRIEEKIKDLRTRKGTYNYVVFSDKDVEILK